MRGATPLRFGRPAEEQKRIARGRTARRPDLRLARTYPFTDQFRARPLAGRGFMGRSYAGILGPLAFATVIGRGLVSQAGLEGTLLAASAALFVFAALGFVVGQLAAHFVSESVRTQFQSAMAAWDNGHDGQHGHDRRHGNDKLQNTIKS